jgi:hypothetical protein
VRDSILVIRTSDVDTGPTDRNFDMTRGAERSC